MRVKCPVNQKGNWLNRGNSKYVDVIPNFNLPALRTRKDAPEPGGVEFLRRKREGLPVEKYWSKKFPLGFQVCKNAGVCAVGCYALCGRYRGWPQTWKAHVSLDFTLHPGFVETISEEIHEEWENNRMVRIHTSGEFYSLPYFKKWVEIARNCPDHEFWVYTKMVRMVKSVRDLPHNLNIIFSEGGREDRFIDRDRDRYSRVFPRFTAPESLPVYGFVDCTEDDSIPICKDKIQKVGLIFHGQGRAFTTAMENPPTNTVFLPAYDQQGKKLPDPPMAYEQEIAVFKLRRGRNVGHALWYTNRPADEVL